MDGCAGVNFEMVLKLERACAEHLINALKAGCSFILQNFKMF